MASRYAQVALAYVRWWPLRVYALAAAAYAVAVVLPWRPSGMEPRAAQLTALAVLLWLLAGGSVLVAAHVKEQLADARAALWPRYRTPHLVIGAAVMLGLTFVFAAALAPRLGLSILGTLAIVSLVVSSTAWWSHLQSFAAGIVCNLLWLSLLLRPVVMAVGNMVYGRNDGLAVALLAAGAAGLVALWIRLARMHEGMTEYRMRLPRDVLVRKTTAAGQATQMAGAGEGWLEPWLHRPIDSRCIAAATLPVRARHLRAATGLGRMPWLMAALMCLTMLALPLLSGGNTFSLGAAQSFMVVLTMLPVLVVTTHWARRWPSLGYESLRPAPRRAFVRELGLAMALDMVETWIALTIGGLIPLLVWAPDVTAQLASNGYVALSPAVVVFIFAVEAWALRLRSGLISVLAMGFVMLIAIVPAVVSEEWSDIAPPGAIAALSGGLLVLAALVTFDAYGRWCRADLE